MQPSLLRKLRRMTRVEWRDLLRAQAALILAQVVVWTRPRGRLVSTWQAPLEVSGTSERARQLGAAVHRVAAYGPFRPSCLVRAVALMRMLNHDGIRGARLCIGVRREGGKLLAHAWVEHGGLVLGDWRAHVRRFQLLADVDVLPPSGLQ